jgi:hypothetical protein
MDAAGTRPNRDRRNRSFQNPPAPPRDPAGGAKTLYN